MEEISPEIQKGVRAALGERFRHGLVKIVQVETKGEKTDEKILALKNCRAFILSSKNPPKLEHEFNYLELELIESTKPKQVKLKLQERRDAFLVTAPSPEETTSIIEFIAESLKRVFPHTSLESFFDVKLEPADRFERLQTHLDCFSLPDLGPCGGFSQMYQFMCDLHNQQYMEEVAWDIDTIYLSQDSTELSLNDFDHLEAKDLVPILSSLMYNTWFKKLSVRDIKLGVEATKEVINVIKKSSSLEQLVLNNAGFKSDFGRDVAVALQSNSSSALVLLDLSNNHLDDRGVKFLCPALARLQNGLVELSMANTQVTAEGVSALGKALSENNFFPTSLMRVNLSGNPLKDGNIEHLLNFLAQPNHVTHLDLSECGIALDTIFSALFRGCVNLTHANFSGNVYTHKKVRDATVPKAVKQFFATTTKLQHFNVANCKLLPDAIKELLLGIGSNKNLETVELNLASNDLRSEGAKVIGSCIANVPNITSLNLSNNDLCLDMANLVVWIGQNKVLSHLDLSDNLTNIRQRNLSTVLDKIVDLIQDEESPIRSLSLAKNKLKFETIPIINALGSNTTLTSIDISGNLMGDMGARMLAKALQINCKLEKILLDNNNISPKGFQDIAEALERNYSLKSIPPPMADLSNCFKSGGSEKAEAAFQQIQSLLQRNHSPQKFADAQAFRLQQGFLYTTSHQLVDKLVVQIQDACKELKDCEEEGVQENIDTATGFIKDADNSKQLLETLHEESRKNESDDVTQQLKEMAAQIQTSVEEKLSKTAEGMIEGTKEKCPHVMENETLKESVIAVCNNRSKIPDKFVLSLIEQLNAQLSNQMSEANLAMAAHISDTIIDEIIDMLMNSHQKMSAHLSKYRNRTLSLSLPMVNGPTSSDETDSGGSTVETPEKTPHFNKKEGDGAPSKTDLRDKRKSVKVRPKSTVIRAQDVITPGPVTTPEPVEEAGPSKSEPPRKVTPVPAQRKPGKPPAGAANISLGDFDAVSSSSQRPLRDARQDRPRRPRNVRPTRAVAVAQTETNPGHSKDDNDGDVKDVSKGVEEFFTTTVEPAFAVPPEKSRESVKDTKKVKKEEKEEKKKEEKKKNKKEEKKPKEEAKKEKKKGGMFSGLFGKKRGSQPQITPEKDTSSSPRRASEPANKVKEAVKPSPQTDRKLSGVEEEESLAGSQTPEYRSSEDELSTKDEVDGKKEEKGEAEEKKDEEPVEEKKPLPAKKALKPGGGSAPFSPNMLAEMKAQQAKRKSKEILEPVPVNGTTETPKKDDKPLPPVKPAATESEDKDDTDKEKEEPPPIEVTPPAKEEETPEKSSAPEENGEVPEKTPSPKKTSPSGQFVLPPSPAKRQSLPQNSVKSTTDSAEANVNDKKETPLGDLDKQETPKGDTTSEPTASPDMPREQTPPSAAKEEETPAVEEDHAASGASSPKSSSPLNHAASPPSISLTVDIEPSGEAEKASPVTSPQPLSPQKSPASSPSTSPAHDSQPPLQPSSPSRTVNPLFVPKKASSFQEKPAKDEVVLQKKSASIGARPVGKGDLGEKVDSGKGDLGKQAIKETDSGKQNGGTEKDVEKEVPEKEDATKKPENSENKTKEDNDTAKEKSGMESAKKVEENAAESNEQPKRSGSISDRMKNFQKPEPSERPAVTLADKRKSFEKKDPPVAAPRPLSTGPKPAPRPKPAVAKRPLSGDKTASPVQSPPGSVVKKPPPVAGRKPVVKP